VSDHKQAEKDYLAEWKRACREAAKWNYEQAKEAGFSLPFDKSYRGRPSCPTPVVEHLDRILFFLGKTQQKRFTVTDDYRYDDLSHAYRILTLDAPTVKAVC
jgi:phenylalanyl-tRNA synthetase alpha subunit